MKFAIPLCAATMLCAGAAQAQVELKTYADANGNLDVQALTCAQLANTFQEDADFMTVWYSGWYNGLANYSKLKVDRAKELEHRVIVYCKANPDVKVIKAMDINIKQMRKEARHQGQRRASSGLAIDGSGERRRGTKWRLARVARGRPDRARPSADQLWNS